LENKNKAQVSTEFIKPLISVVMANYCGELYIEDAINSVLQQSIKEIELIISDDASSDRSVEIVRNMMKSDNRIRLLTSEINQGPARARNRALDEVRGEWVSIVDSDDLLHPCRFEKLLLAADRFNADIVADDLLHFNTSDSNDVSFLLSGRYFSQPFNLTLDSFLGDQDQNAPAFGYLKPLFRATILKGVRYDETLKIGEDYELVLRLLIKGARYTVIPQPFYLYRRHNSSISYRLSVKTVEAMIVSHEKIRSAHGPFSNSVEKIFDANIRSLNNALLFERFIAEIKARHFVSGAKLAIRHPGLIGKFARIFGERTAKLLKRRDKVAPETQAKITIFFEDTQTLPVDLTTANDFALKHNSTLLIEAVPDLQDIATLWEKPYDVQKKQHQRLARFSGLNTVALLYNNPAGYYYSGFIPAPEKRTKLTPINN
jgi:succinoglycan biosynthesis protein ExoO